MQLAKATLHSGTFFVVSLVGAVFVSARRERGDSFAAAAAAAADVDAAASVGRAKLACKFQCRSLARIWKLETDRQQCREVRARKGREREGGRERDRGASGDGDGERPSRDGRRTDGNANGCGQRQDMQRMADTKGTAPN